MLTVDTRVATFSKGVASIGETPFYKLDIKSRRKAAGKWYCCPADFYPLPRGPAADECPRLLSLYRIVIPSEVKDCQYTEME